MYFLKAVFDRLAILLDDQDPNPVDDLMAQVASLTDNSREFSIASKTQQSDPICTLLRYGYEHYRGKEYMCAFMTDSW